MAEKLEVTGIVAEFNPFHNGHKYLLEKASGIKVVAMSGNWVQRGGPAIFDKWTRAAMALQNGADLVIELPVQVSVQAADYFASGSVESLAKLGVTRLVFGSESDTDYNAVAQFYQENAQKMSEFLENLPNQLSYPEKTQRAWQAFGGVQFNENTPNHVLGLAYAKAAAGFQLDLQPVARIGSFHALSAQGQFASATAIRQKLLTKCENHEKKILSAVTECEKHENFSFSLDEVIPDNLQSLYQSPKTSWTAYFPLLQYKIISADLSKIFQMNDELANRIKAANRQAKTFEQLVELSHTKRYTKARIRRLLTYILLDFPRELALPEQLHVLGFTAKGQQLLAQNRGKFVSKIGQNPWDSLTQQADQIYQLGNPAFTEQNHGRKPLIFP